MSLWPRHLAGVACRQVHSKVKLSKEPLVDRIKNNIAWHLKGKPKLYATSTFLYEACVDKVCVTRWFQHFNMPDTYLSWHLVTQLHVWMMLTRIMAEPDENRRTFLRNELCVNLWTDSQIRMDKLTALPRKTKQKCMTQLSQNFQATVLICDEGLMKDDQALAGALWRALFLCDEKLEDFGQLRTAVHYVRRNIASLDQLPSDRLDMEDGVQWKSLEESIMLTRENRR